VVICASPSQELCVEGTHPIVIPPPSSRTSVQLEHVVVEYAADAARLLGADKPLSAADRAWVLAHAAQKGTALSLGAISKATLRLTMLRAEGSIALAATRLGMARVSLAKWFARRPPPPGLSAEEIAALASADEESDA
jgi:Flp pilus assembly secretin CpaC